MATSMTNPTWPIGPARTRDGREARIYATDGGGSFPIHGAVAERDGWTGCVWRSTGHYGTAHAHPADLLPPKLTRDEAIAECKGAHNSRHDFPLVTTAQAAAIIAHWEKLKAEGRVE